METRKAVPSQRKFYKMVTDKDMPIAWTQEQAAEAIVKELTKPQSRS